MANVLNRTTKQYITSANTPEYPVAQWIHAPNLSAVTGFASKYWIITGDVVTLEDAGARAARDAAAVEAQRDSAVAPLDQLEDIQRAFMLVMLDQLNTLRGLHGLPAATPAQLRSAVRGKLGS